MKQCRLRFCILAVFYFGTTIFADSPDKGRFVWSSIGSSSNPSTGISSRSFFGGSGSSQTKRSPLVVQFESDDDDDSTPKDRSFISDLFGSLGSQTNLENNFLSIQSSNTKVTQNNGGAIVGGLGGGLPPPVVSSSSFQPGPVISPGVVVGGGGGGIMPPPPPPGTGLAGGMGMRPSAIPDNCDCLPTPDCRDISGFARQIRRFQQTFCAIGTVVCCSEPVGPGIGIGMGNGNLGRPVSIRPPPPPPVVVAVDPPFPGPSGPMLGGKPRGGQCGRKGGNPLARTLDAGNPHDAAEFGEYPWMAAILAADLTYVCGGALIDVNIVVTAAHCVAKLKFSDIVVRLGEYDVAEMQEPPFQDVHVRNVVINGDYHSGTLRNDIAVLVLDMPAAMNGYIRPVCLPPPQDLSGLICTVTGWGKNRPRGKFSSILKEVDLPIIDNGRCENMLRGAPELGPMFNLHPSMLCAGLPGKDACHGDGGSPLVCNIDGAWRLAGLVSWGIGCGQYPGVYTRVGSFVPWISDVISRS